MWTLKVEKYAKIDSAQITIAPFTMFIGDNNSGKSYIMTLIYGLLTTKFRNFTIDETSELYKECYEILQLEGNLSVKEFSELEFAKFVQLLNEVLELNKLSFLQQLFNKEVDIERIQVEISYIEGFSIKYIEIDEITNTGAVFSYIFNRQQNNMKYNVGISIKNSVTLNYLEIIRYLLYSILQCVNGRFVNTPVYFPTSRTGFMLTFKKIVETSLSENFALLQNRNSSMTTLLTKPCIDFLSSISTLSNNRKIEEYNDIVTFIDKNIIDGSVEYNDLPVSDICYIPAGSNNKEGIPLHVSSGVVTELAPLSLYLKYKEFDMLMMEEPEMCLHPYLQWQMTRVLIQLMNKGNHVLITTHSDTILQHINNMIKLNVDNTEQLNAYGYSEKDKLWTQQIKVYQFNSKKNHKTEIQELECTVNGFVAPTFNDTLIRMLKEARSFEITEE